MKRLLTLLVIAWMTFTIAACSGANTGAESTAAPPASGSPQASASSSPANTPQASASTAPANTPQASASTAPSDTPQASASSAPSDAPKTSAAPAPAADSAKPSAAATVKPADDTPTAAPQPEISPKGKKLLFVGRDQDPVPAEDVAIENRLKGMGFQVTRLGDRDFTADETKGYDFLYFSQTTNSKFLKDGVMKNVAIPTLYVKSHGMFYLGLTSLEEGAVVKNMKAVDIVDSKHKIAGGLSGTVDVFKEAGERFGIGYGLPGKEAKVIATVPGDSKKAALYYYDKGSKADNGYEVKARISFYYWSNGMQDNSTDAGWKLWDNIVLWTLQNG